MLGLDSHRVALIVAVMEKRLGMNLSGLDIFMNVTGGVRIAEPSADLAIAAALAGSFLDRPVDKETTLIGEVGLTGEIRGRGPMPRPGLKRRPRWALSGYWCPHPP